MITSHPISNLPTPPPEINTILLSSTGDCDKRGRQLHVTTYRSSWMDKRGYLTGFLAAMTELNADKVRVYGFIPPKLEHEDGPLDLLKFQYYRSHTGRDVVVQQLSRKRTAIIRASSITVEENGHVVLRLIKGRRPDGSMVWERTTELRRQTFEMSSDVMPTDRTFLYSRLNKAMRTLFYEYRKDWTEEERQDFWGKLTHETFLALLDGGSRMSAEEIVSTPMAATIVPEEEEIYTLFCQKRTELSGDKAAHAATVLYTAIDQLKAIYRKEVIYRQ